MTQCLCGNENQAYLSPRKNSAALDYVTSIKKVSWRLADVLQVKCGGSIGTRRRGLSLGRVRREERNESNLVWSKGTLSFSDLLFNCLGQEEQACYFSGSS